MIYLKKKKICRKGWTSSQSNVSLDEINQPLPTVIEEEEKNIYLKKEITAELPYQQLYHSVLMDRKTVHPTWMSKKRGISKV